MIGLFVGGWVSNRAAYRSSLQEQHKRPGAASRSSIRAQHTGAAYRSSLGIQDQPEQRRDCAGAA
eukprot:2211477-Rhodomonas_salina.2